MKASVHSWHAKYYLALARQTGLDWHIIEREWPQIRRAWAWVDVEWPQIQRAWKWLVNSEESSARVVAYALAFYDFQDQRGLWREATVWSQQGLEVARMSEAENVEGILLNNLGTALANLGEVQRAINLHERKLILARDTQARDSEKNALLNLGVAYHRLGQITRAIEYY